MTQDTREPRLGALSRTRRRTLYGISVGVWVTGAVWLVYHYFVRSIDQFGFENAHPHQQWWLVAHAAFGCWALWMFGVLWPGHVKADEVAPAVGRDAVRRGRVADADRAGAVLHREHPVAIVDFDRALGRRTGGSGSLPAAPADPQNSSTERGGARRLARAAPSARAQNA